MEFSSTKGPVEIWVGAGWPVLHLGQSECSRNPSDHLDWTLCVSEGERERERRKKVSKGEKKYSPVGNTPSNSSEKQFSPHHQ